MSDFSIKSILGHFNTIDINNKSVTIDNNNSNKRSNKRYALGANYDPSTKESSAAAEICSKLNDCENFALHYSIVKHIGTLEAFRLLHETFDDVKEAEKNGKPIKNNAALFNWKVQNLQKKHKKI